MSKNTIHLIDGSSFLYRFFFAIKGLSKNGFPTGAIFGFARMLLELDKDSPDYIAILFDTKAKTFRKDILESYKQNRPKMPDELSVQIEPIKELISYFGIKIIEKDGYEADDLIATFSEKFKKDHKIIIVANDKDLMQLVENDKVLLYDPEKKIFYKDNDVYDKLGVYPYQVADYLALIGDSIDNIPGVKSIGPKTASFLLKEYKTCEDILDNLDKIKPKLKEAIENDGNLLTYKQLTKLDKNVPVNITLEDIKRQKKQQDKIADMFAKFGFKSLLKEMDIEPQVKQKDIGTEIPIIFKQDDKIYIKEKKQTREIKPCKLNKHVVVYNLKALMQTGFLFEHLPFDIKLGCYLINSDSEGNIETCFDNINDTLSYKLAKTKQFEDKLTISYPYIKHTLEEQSMDSLLWNVEIPLSVVLYKMEKVGLKIDIDYLIKFKNELLNKQETIKQSIYSLANEEFNINSTKELQRILFDKLKIKPLRKTKTGYSTDYDTLTELSKKHEIAALIIKYREIAKVISTYIIPFIEKVDENNRLHTTFNQTLTSTGRLSSSNPNLQNLPASDDEIHYGIRKSVIAKDGYKLICSDYSQIELRVLAQLCKDETLIDIFNKNEDIHTQTAVKLFGVHPSMVDHNLRRMAKTINFGILYGMGYVSLAKTLNISRAKAKDIIEKYFERFEKVKIFIDKTIENATKNGYVETYFKRRRYFYNINSPNQRLASFEKRAAVNAVIQGTAADIIKMAMVELDKKLNNIDANIVLQVHDELLIEANQTIVNNAMEIVKSTMENIVKFDIPLSVNINSADNWLEAK